MSTLAERALSWKEAAPAASAGGEERKAAQPSGAAKEKAQKGKNTSGVGFPPSWVCRAACNGYSAAATGASSTTSTAVPTQPALPHPPPHQASLDSSSRLSSRSSSRSSNLNISSSSSSSSSCRRPREAGFNSQAWPTSAGRLAAVGEAEADVEAPTRGAAAPGDAVSDSLGSAEPTAGGGGRQNELVPCSQTRGGTWDLVVHLSLGQFPRPYSTVRKRG